MPESNRNFKLSIIIPVYNEESTIAALLEKVLAVDIPKEIIVVDDGSRDHTVEILKRKADENSEVVQVHANEVNVGKGAAIRRGLLHVKGDVVLIQDADLELDPNEYHRIVEPLKSGEAHVVYGSRFKDVGYFRHYKNIPFISRLVNWMLATTVNIFWPNAHITDEATAYKAFRADLIKSMHLRCNRFEFCPEVTSKILNRGLKIHEVPITYHPRTVNEGKKVNWTDGVYAFWTLFKYRFLQREEPTRHRNENQI